jgi:hypothetical protein
MTFTKRDLTPPSPARNDALEPRSRPKPLKILPPLSALTYYRRNVTRTLPIGGAIVISVFLVAAIVTLLNSVDQSIATNYGFVQRFSVVASNLERDISPRSARAPCQFAGRQGCTARSHRQRHALSCAAAHHFRRDAGSGLRYRAG